MSFDSSSTNSSTNSPTGAEALVRLLVGHGVEHIFGLCGDTTLPLYDAFYRLDHGITHFLTRDERHAGYMADAYSRITHKVGVCEGPSGGGATYILPGVVEADQSSIPLLAITTDVATSSRGRFPLTELDQVSLYRSLTHYNGSLDDAARLPDQVRAAFRAMTELPMGAAHLALPFDTQGGAVGAESIYADLRYGSYPASRPCADLGAIGEAARLFVGAERGLIICGGGPVLSGGEAALLEFARYLGMPVATSVSGQGSIAETDPLAVGVVGANGGVVATRRVVEESDLIFFVGCRAGSVTTEKWRYPRSGAKGVKIVHLDGDADVPSANYPTEVVLTGDIKVTLEALLEEVRKHGSAEHHGEERALSAWKAKLADFETLSGSNERPIRPERVIAALMRTLDSDAIIAADPGTPCPYFSAFYRWQRSGRRFITNRAHGALGFSLAAAIGAQVAEPQTCVVAAMGDGSFGMSVGELETATRYRLPVKVIVFSNATYGWIRAGQRASFDEHFYNVDFSRSDHAAIAAGFGIKSWRVEDPSELESVFAEMLRLDEPTLVDIVSQPLDEARAPVSEWVA
ncbi:MAG: thiamine pyrophosphate-binding protein [Alphaproteobacteria bacterium]